MVDSPICGLLPTSDCGKAVHAQHGAALCVRMIPDEVLTMVADYPFSCNMQKCSISITQSSAEWERSTMNLDCTGSYQASPLTRTRLTLRDGGESQGAALPHHFR